MLGLVRAEPSARLSAVRLTITALNLVVGALFLVRGPILARAPLGALLLSLPSLAMSGVALKLAPPEASWPLYAAALFAASGLFAIASLATLGRSFGLLPAVRGVVTGGPFRYLRHPAYAGELGMVAACALASPRPWLALPLVPLAAGLIAARIQAEERLLSALPEYQAYAARVRFRLIPGIW